MKPRQWLVRRWPPRISGRIPVGLVKRMPKAKAKTAIARSILVIVFELLADPAKRYKDLGPGHYAHRIDVQRRTGTRPSAAEEEIRPLTKLLTPGPAADLVLIIAGVFVPIAAVVRYLSIAARPVGDRSICVQCWFSGRCASRAPGRL